MSAPDFWDNQETAQQYVQNASRLKQVVANWQAISKQVEEAKLLLDLVAEEPDEELQQEVQQLIKQINGELEALELASLLNGEYDSNNAILTIHPGAGGTESQDWAEMLLRMYTRWAERRGFQVEQLNLLPGDEAGIKVSPC